MGNDLKSRAVHGIVWSFFERFSVGFANFVITIIIARLLTPEDYGLIGMLSIFMSISQVFIDGGFSSALIQRKDRSDSDLSTVFYINVGIGILIYIIIFLCSEWISDFYHQPLLEKIIKIYCLTLVINSFVGVPRTILTIRLDFKTQSKVSLLSSILSGILGIISAYSGYGVWALVIQSLAFSLLNVGISYLLVKWIPKIVFSMDSFRNLFSFGSKLLTASLISAAYDNAYNLVIGKYFSSAQLGYYTRASSFTDFATSNVSAVLTRVAFPLLSEYQNDDEVLIKVYTKYIGLCAFIMFPISMLLCGIAHPLIIFLLTDKWEGCVIILQILCFSTLWRGIVTINLNLLNVKGRSDLVLKLEIWKKVFAFSILIISLLFQNFIILCLGLVLYSLVGLYMNTIYTGRILNYGFIKQMKDIFPYLLISLFILLESFLISKFISIPVISLLVSIIVCTPSYLLLCRKLKLYAMIETEAQVRNVIHNIKLKYHK